MKRYYLVASGRVQGVGFRFFVQNIATDMNLTGWVKNCDDGTVKMEVQGNLDFIEEFKVKLKKGNYFAKVHDLFTEEIQIKLEEKKFKIVY